MTRSPLIGCSSRPQSVAGWDQRQRVPQVSRLRRHCSREPSDSPAMRPGRAGDAPAGKRRHCSPEPRRRARNRQIRHPMNSFARPLKWNCGIERRPSSLATAVTARHRLNDTVDPRGMRHRCNHVSQSAESWRAIRCPPGRDCLGAWIWSPIVTYAVAQVASPAGELGAVAHGHSDTVAETVPPDGGQQLELSVASGNVK